MKPDKHLILKSLIWLLFAAITLTGCSQKDFLQTAQDADTSCISQGWPHDKSDLQPDPALHFGTLDNGLRFVIMHNEEPKDRVGLYLNIQAGSLEEDDDQLGYAHFLEHMLFNGTTHYPPGTLVEYFQSIGMGFGSDTNAHTSFDETVYRLLLPDGSEKNLSEGLLVLADYARGALLLESEVERERGIILAEKRTRDSAGYRLWENRTKFTFAGTRVANRFPIGTDETLRSADSSSLRLFYDSWYRPENMILVVVGDVDIDLAKNHIENRFNHLSTPDIDPVCYDLGTVEESGEQFLFIHEPEIGSTELTIRTNWNVSPENDSAAMKEMELKKHIAASLLQNRLQQMVREPGSPMTKAYTYSGIFLERIGYATVTSTVEGGDWQKGLELLGTTLRQALENGFTLRELTRVKKEIIAHLEKQVQTVSSRDSRKLASEIIETVNSNDVYLSPSQELELYRPIVESLSLDDANETFRKMWAHDNRKILVAGTAEIAGDSSPEENIRLVYEKTMKRDLKPWHEKNAIAFPYLPLPDAVPNVASHVHFDEIDMDRYTYENGTVLQIKKTLFQPNEVLVEIHFGKGKKSEIQPGISMIAEPVVNESGVGQLTSTELDDALAGNNINASFAIGEESFVLRGGGLSNKLELLLQLVRTRLLDPAFREDAYNLSMDRFSQMYEQMSSTVEGKMQLEGERFLAGGSSYYGMPSEEQFKQITLQQIKEWIAPVFANAPLEISIVGDVDPLKVVNLVGAYFGYQERSYEQPENNESAIFPSGERIAGEVITQVDKALVVVAWPTDDFWNISRTRRLNILSAVFSDRLRVEIREKLGAVYSPSVYNQSSKTEPGYGALRAMMTVDPAQTDIIADKVRQVGQFMAQEGITEAELTRSLEPVLTSIKDMIKSNRYWMGSVLTLSSRHPQQLEWPLTIQSDFASISAKEVSDYASKYLGPDTSAEILIMPIVP